MTIINITGLPGNVKLPKVVFSLKNVLKGEGIVKFWIKEMFDIRGSDMKAAKVEFNEKDAYIAVQVLNGFVFHNGPIKMPLSAVIEDDEARPRHRSPSPYEYRREEIRERYEDPRERYGDVRERYVDTRERYDDMRERYQEPVLSKHDYYPRERSRSPASREASKLDMEIELLRKQRMIIEEERRLMLERKKLELLKEYGPSALRDFKDLEEGCSHVGRDRDRNRRYRPERSPEYRPRRRSPPPPPRFKPKPRPPPKVLPQFVLPCKIILEDLKEHLKKYTKKTEANAVSRLMRLTIRKRLAVALENQPIMAGAKIVVLYRKKYPNYLDEDFVKKHVKDFKACHLTAKGEEKKTNVTTKIVEVNNGTDKNGVEDEIEDKQGNIGEEKEECGDDKGEGDDGEENNEDVDEKEVTDVGNIKMETEELTKDQTSTEEAQIEETATGGQADDDIENEGSTSIDASVVVNDTEWVEGEHGWEDAIIKEL